MIDFLRRLLRVKPEIIEVGVKVYSVKNKEPLNGDVCIVHTSSGWRQFTWYNVTGMSKYYGWYNNNDDHQYKTHDLYFYPPKTKDNQRYKRNLN